MTAPLTIGIIGGTGPQGKGLALRFARAGHRVVVGSRSADRAEATAAELHSRLRGSGDIRGAANATAAGAELVVVAVPYDGFGDLLRSLAASLTDKIVVTCVNPLGFDKRGPYRLSVPEGSAAELAAAALPGSRIVSAFHHLSAVNLVSDDPDSDSGEDVLVCGDDRAAKDVVRDLAAAVTGRVGIDAGSLRISRELEGFTAVLISINKRYKAHSGVAITGLGSATGR